MDPVKKDGKIREQIEIEHVVRRRYEDKWGCTLRNSELTALYDPNHVNARVQSSSAATVPDTHTGRGQSHQMSAQMYNALKAVCRCGRSKVGAHRLRCLQAQPPPVIPPRMPADKLVLPKTSLGMYGWPPVSRYAELQHATRYVSPTNDIPGGRLSDHPHASVYMG